MKRTIISLLFCAVMLLSAACGKEAVFPVPVSPEPETEIVMPDQAGVSVPTPASVGGWDTNSRLLSEMDPAPSEKIESPSHVADEFAYEKLKIIWDADVTVPEIGAYAVMRVQKRELSKDELLSVIEGLTGTTNDIYTSWTMNRSEVQAMLEEAVPYEGTERLPKEYLKNLKNLLKNAPERNENILADQNKLVTYSSLYVPVSGGTAAQFVLSDGFLYYVRDIHTEAYPQWDMMESQFDSSYETKSHFEWKKPGEPELPKEAALAVAEEYLREMGIELVVKEAAPCSVLRNNVDKHTGWAFTFTREVAGLRFLDERFSSYSVGNGDSAPKYMSGWGPEIATIIVDKAGIAKLKVTGLSTNAQTVMESVTLLAFDGLKGVISDTLNRQYSHSELAYDIKVTSISLGTSLISERNAPDIGYYIPSWFVTYSLSGMENAHRTIIFAAADGSYIEPRAYYEDV